MLRNMLLQIFQLKRLVEMAFFTIVYMLPGLLLNDLILMFFEVDCKSNTQELPEIPHSQYLNHFALHTASSPQ